MSLEIISATYFTKKHSFDVAEALRGKINENGLDILASNEIAGDPHYGVVKKLRVTYMLNGKTHEKTVVEGGRLRIMGGAESIIVGSLKKVHKIAHPTLLAQGIKSETTVIPDKIQKPNMTDIIIPSCGNEHLTIACFESIKACTEKGTYRIIWVDNGSKDKRKAQAALKDVEHTSILLKTNTGFVNAVNTGLAKSDAPTVCILNNDTEVSPRWLEKLTNILYSDPELGIVGPLTGPPAEKKRYDSHHNIAYQQNQRKVPVFPYYRNLIDFNEKIENMFPRMVGEISFVAFLCGVLKREVIEKVTAFHPSYAKGLDPNYDRGMWDDCDYMRAATKIGYKSKIALDTCIIHKGRSTFKVLQEKEKFDVDALVKKNRKYMDRKWKLIEKAL